jgi:hypothetical protein
VSARPQPAQGDAQIGSANGQSPELLLRLQQLAAAMKTYDAAAAKYNAMLDRAGSIDRGITGDYQLARRSAYHALLSIAEDATAAGGAALRRYALDEHASFLVEHPMLNRHITLCCAKDRARPVLPAVAPWPCRRLMGLAWLKLGGRQQNGVAQL